MRLWTAFVLAFTALLPLINPPGSALILLGLVGEAPLSLYRTIARRVAVNNLIFLAVIALLGSSILKFFGISLPIVQVSGGFVITGIGWSMLNSNDARPSTRIKQDKADPAILIAAASDFEDRYFYPFTFPITSGPGTLVVMLTLSAHTVTGRIAGDLLAYLGLFSAVAAMSVLIYFCYAYAPRLTKVLPASTVNGVVRVMGFIVLCIGAQIAWKGITALLASR